MAIGTKDIHSHSIVVDVVSSNSVLVNRTSATKIVVEIEVIKVIWINGKSFVVLIKTYLIHYLQVHELNVYTF